VEGFESSGKKYEPPILSGGVSGLNRETVKIDLSLEPMLVNSLRIELSTKLNRKTQKSIVC
jgi:hypothetical protein